VTTRAYCYKRVRRYQRVEDWEAPTYAVSADGTGVTVREITSDDPLRPGERPFTYLDVITGQVSAFRRQREREHEALHGPLTWEEQAREAAWADEAMTFLRRWLDEPRRIARACRPHQNLLRIARGLSAHRKGLAP
jgi:hypothetical protein